MLKLEGNNFPEYLRLEYELWSDNLILGHSLVSPVPSLFTFQIADARLKDLLGVTVFALKLHLFLILLNSVTLELMRVRERN